MPRIIVTRPVREATQWVDQLTARGLSAVALPLIAIGPCTGPGALQALQAAREQLARYRAVMFVSGNAVVHFFEQNTPEVLCSSWVLAPEIRAWSPGPGTARALEQAGVPRTQIDGPAADAAQFDSEALWQQVSRQIRPGDRVLIVRGQSEDPHDSTHGTGRDWLAQQVDAAGGQAVFVAAYARCAPQLGPAEVALAQQAAHDGSVWLLSSSQALAHLAQALPAQRWTTARALATHPRIAQAARQAGFGQVRECRPALDDVVASIELDP